MYIDKYWGDFIGGSDDSLNLVAFLEDLKKEEIPLDVYKRQALGGDPLSGLGR